MKTVSRMMVGLVSVLVLVSLACGGTGGNVSVPEGNVPQVNVPAGGVPQATLDAANTRAADLAGQAGDAGRFGAQAHGCGGVGDGVLAHDGVSPVALAGCAAAACVGLVRTILTTC